MKTFAFTVQGRAAPSLNGHLDRMKRLEAWYQEVREAIRTQTGLPPQLVLSGAARAKLAAPLHLEPGERATLSLYQFDTVHETVLSFEPLDQAAHYHLEPRGQTALLDGAGFAITAEGEKRDAYLPAIALQRTTRRNKEQRIMGLEREVLELTAKFEQANAAALSATGERHLLAGLQCARLTILNGYRSLSRRARISCAVSVCAISAASPV